LITVRMDLMRFNVCDLAVGGSPNPCTFCHDAQPTDVSACSWFAFFSSLNCDFKSLFISNSRRAWETLTSNWSGSAPLPLIIFAFVVNIWKDFKIEKLICIYKKHEI
ncbi:hypothetical protein ALC57_12040, partial [Trachymyrmex cornetzi]